MPNDFGLFLCLMGPASLVGLTLGLYIRLRHPALGEQWNKAITQHQRWWHHGGYALLYLGFASTSYDLSRPTFAVFFAVLVFIEVVVAGWTWSRSQFARRNQSAHSPGTGGQC